MRLRADRGLNRKEFAKKIGYSERSVLGWETGDVKRMPSREAMIVIDLFFARDISGLRYVNDNIKSASRTLARWARDENAMIRGLSILGVGVEAIVQTS